MTNIFEKSCGCRLKLSIFSEKWRYIYHKEILMYFKIKHEKKSMIKTPNFFRLFFNLYIKFSNTESHSRFLLKYWKYLFIWQQRFEYSFCEKLYPVFQKSAYFEKILSIIWLEIIIEFISKIRSQMIGNFKNGFAFLNTFLVKFWKISCINHFYPWYPRTYQST